MSRAASGDRVTVKPTNNIYTALLGAAVMVALVGVILVFMRSKTLGIDLLSM